jgi:tetratricopeptide (TPR) repeat protein
MAWHKHGSRLFPFLVLFGLLLQLNAAQKKPATPVHHEIATPLTFLHWTPPREAPVSAFVHVNVIPMDHDRMHRNQTVVIRAGEIVGIGPTGDTPIPPHALVIDGANKYLIPGLVDMHAQIYSPGEMLLYLANGVTMVRSINGRPQHLTWRDRITAGQLLGPTMWTTGPTIYAADTAAEGKRLELEQRRAGYNAMDIRGDVSADAFQAITTAARSLGFPIFGDINTSVGLNGTVAAPQFFSIEGAQQYASVVFKDNPDTPEAAISEAAAETRHSRIWLTPALVAFGNAVQEVEDLPRFLSRPEIRYLPPWTRREWNSPNNFYQNNFDKEQAALLRRKWAFQKRIVSIMHREQVGILLGTDAMAVGTVPGFSAPEELANLVEAGFTPFEALQTATRNPHDWFPDMNIDFGMVTKGGRADLILLEANPLVDIRNVSRISGVMIRGRWLEKRELQKMLAALPAAYSEEAKFLASTASSQPDVASKYLRENDPFGKLSNEVMLNFVLEKGVDALKQFYSHLQQVDPPSIVIGQETVNDLGFQLLSLNRNSDALEVFRFNLRAHPTSANVYDSLAQAQLKSGNEAEAVRYYNEALRVDPSFRHAREALEKLKSEDSRN